MWVSVEVLSSASREALHHAAQHHQVIQVLKIQKWQIGDFDQLHLVQDSQMRAGSSTDDEMEAFS